MRSLLLAAAQAALLLGAVSSASGAPPFGLPRILSEPSVRAQVPLPDFSYAGYGFGLSPLPSDPGQVIDAAAYGVKSDDGLDDAKALLRALAAANRITGRVTVRLPPGRIQIGEIIPIERSDLVLEGAGADEGGTELYFPRPLKIVDKSDRQDELRGYIVRENKYERQPDQNIDFLFSEYSWSGGFLNVGPPRSRAASYDPGRDVRDKKLSDALSGQQFSRQLRVSSPGALSVGQVVQLQWFSVDGPRSAILRSLYGDIGAWNAAAPPSQRLEVGSHHWAFPERPVVTQATRISAIRGDVVTLGDPLLHDISAAQPAVIAEWEHLTQVGIQHLRLTFPDNPWLGHHLELGYNGIYFTGVFDGWIRNVAIHNADSGILTDNAASLTIDDVTTSGEHVAHYSVHVGAVHNVLVRNLRVENPVIHPLSVNTRSTRSVYLRATVQRDAIIDQHSGSNHQNLFDQLDLTVTPKQDAKGAWSYQLWDSGGADYWKPGHGRMNTQWNIRLHVKGPPAGEKVLLRSGLEGPGARIVGLHADRPIAVSYAPDPYEEYTGYEIQAAPSLYEYQLAQRRAADERARGH